MIDRSNDEQSRCASAALGSVSDLFPVQSLHVQLHQSLQVAHLGVGLGGVAVVLQLGEVERALGQGFALRLVQLAGDADEPARGRREAGSR